MKKVIAWSAAAVLVAAIGVSAGYEWTDPGTEQMTARMIKAGVTEELIEELLQLPRDCETQPFDGLTTLQHNREHTRVTVREYHEGEPDNEFCFTETVIYDHRRKKK